MPYDLIKEKSVGSVNLVAIRATATSGERVDKPHLLGDGYGLWFRRGYR